MEHRLPKEIKGFLPPNTMDTDFKAELYGALLSEAGFDTAQIMMVRDGNNLSNVSKDIRSVKHRNCLLYTSPSPRDGLLSRMPSSA